MARRRCRRRHARSERRGCRAPLAERGRRRRAPSLPDEHGAIHHRGHLAHVPRPSVPRQHPHVVVGNRHRPQPEPIGGALGEVLGEHPDVARAIAQRRDDDRKHRQAVVEILAECLRLDHRRQIAVGGGDDADADADRALAADADHFAVLHDAQQAHLRGERAARRLRRGTACRRRPARTSPCAASCAPVNAPGSCPKSSESISSAAIAPQFTRRNGPFRNGECSWMARATISLPVPVSPNSSTGALLRDTMRARAMTAASPVSPPISRSSPARESPSIKGLAAGPGAPAGACFCDIRLELAMKLTHKI